MNAEFEELKKNHEIIRQDIIAEIGENYSLEDFNNHRYYPELDYLSKKMVNIIFDQSNGAHKQKKKYPIQPIFYPFCIVGIATVGHLECLYNGRIQRGSGGPSHLFRTSKL